MITIGLDEYGHFELEDFSFIGGLVYDGEDYKEEAKRILEFLKKACCECNGKYPDDLHKNKDNENNNKEKVIQIKKYVSENIYEFLKASGKYHIVCMVRDNTYRSDCKSKSNLVSDNYAGNRYEHMMYNTVNNIIFNNIFSKEKDINLNIATRISVIPLEEKKMINEFERLGYKSNGKNIKYKKLDSKSFFGTDEKTFRTFLSTIMIYKRNEEINFNKLNITSIDYKDSEDMAFLYLSDFICNFIKTNYLKESFKPKYSYEFNFEEFYKEAIEMSKDNHPYIWAYDNIDGIYNNIMDSYYGENIYNVLKYIFEGKESENKYSNFYNKYWFKNISKRIKEICTINNIEDAINTLEENIKGKENKYIFEEINKLIECETIKSHRKYYMLKYKLADLGLRIYNHSGSIVKSEEQFDICKSLKEKVGIMTYLETTNRQSVSLSNRFEFEQALELSKYNEECYEIMKNSMKDIAELNGNKEDASWKLLGYGKSLSSSGQYLAFMKNEEALEKLEAAIKEFNGDSKNITQTISYILHYAIDNNLKSLYEKYAQVYFNNISTFEEQFNYIINGGFSNNDRLYALYVFIKGLNVFYTERVSLSLLEKIRTTDYKNALEFNMDCHPWELIYKHLAYLYMRKENDKYFNDCINKALEIKDGDITVELIKYSIKLEYYYKIDDIKLLNKTIKEFSKYVNENSIDAFKECISNDNLDIYNKINSKFTFMYK